MRELSHAARDRVDATLAVVRDDRLPASVRLAALEWLLRVGWGLTAEVE